MENKLNKEKITTYIEIKDILAEIDSLEKKLEELNQNNGNKEDKYYIIDKLYKLKHKLEKGINLNLNFDIFKDSIILFLKNLGFLNNDILEKLSNVRFVVTEVKFLTNAKMYNVSNNVYIDSSYIEFDINGYPIGIKKEKIEEFNHVIIHELLHLISYVDYKPLTGEALSEGYTDLFTLMITKNPNIISKHYLPFLKIAYLFTNMIGVNNSMDDYLNNLGTYNNLSNLLCSLGFPKSYIRELNNKFNHILELLRTNDNSSETHINEIINELKVILEKYIKQYPDKTNILDLFNNLFNNKNEKKMTV